MENGIIEAAYPIDFRKKDAVILGQLLKDRNSVVLIGMKRVGISNFLRFFLYHKDVVKNYITDGNLHLFIKVDLNDLVEREVFPFWILTLKRISDAVGKSSLNKPIKKYIETLFLDCIQSKDTFLTIESIRKSLSKIVEQNVMPTIFFIRFDRLKDIVTTDLFGNLQGLKDATNNKLAYVFTSFRGLSYLAPSVFKKPSLSLFTKDLYIKPAEKTDANIIFKTYTDHYKLSISSSLEGWLFAIVDGYVQYLQLALIFLHETKKVIQSKDEIFNLLSCDERIGLQSEELWESLGDFEKATLLKIIRKEPIGEKEKMKAKYLWDTGLINQEGKSFKLFSPLLDYFVRQKDISSQLSVADFTKKENLLFNFLKENLGQICEREKIIEAVWPEVEELGVSDWAIDRLVARVRSKLLLQKAGFEIQTIKTRGYKLITV
ncbi:MAG: helix-turn-helix domain-containing protein [Candidatus Levybacteria bacterium]|nr:helix-turn-helix domain-containing protein [Candidatus Levybacteria bacterium]